MSGGNSLRLDGARQLSGPDLFISAISIWREGIGAYPKICRASVEVEHESLCWSTDLNWAEILRVVLDVLCSHLAGFCA